MKFADHVRNSADAVKHTFPLNRNIARLPLKSGGKIYVVGSGSSYSNALYFEMLFEKYFSYPVLVHAPYSFVRQEQPTSKDVLIHITQEAKRNDNRSPLEYAAKRGMKSILFTSKETELSKLADEVYYFAPETEKILVASMSYMAANALVLQYIASQAKVHKQKFFRYNISEIARSVKSALKAKFQYGDYFTVFMYSGFGESVAVEGALKVNECLLQDAESYEIKHYSHGKHFQSHKRKRVFNVLFYPEDKELISLYKKSVFEKQHVVNIMESHLASEISVFEHGTLMLSYIAQAMRKKKIELNDISVREENIIPHTYKY